MRAYVFVKTLVLTTQRAPDRYSTATGLTTKGAIEAYAICADLENSGATPTRHLRCGIRCRLFPHEMPKDWDYPADHVAPMIIGPRATISSATVILTPAEMDAIAQGQRHCYIWGWMDYNDVFEGTPRHRTEFCFKVTAMRSPGGALSVAFPTYGPFNAADDDCMRQPKPYKN